MLCLYYFDFLYKTFCVQFHKSFLPLESAAFMDSVSDQIFYANRFLSSWSLDTRRGSSSSRSSAAAASREHHRFLGCLSVWALCATAVNRIRVLFFHLWFPAVDETRLCQFSLHAQHSLCTVSLLYFKEYQ